VKKLGIAFVCLIAVIASMNAQAQDDESWGPFDEGLVWEGNAMLGVTGGYASRHGNIGIVANGPGQHLEFNNNMNSHGGVWGIFGGYQVFCNGILFGLELNVQWEDIEQNNDYVFLDDHGIEWTGVANYKREPAVGLSGRFGSRVSRCFIPYVRLGLETSRDKLALFAVRDPFFVPLEADIEGDRQNFRLFAGLGAEIPLLLKGLVGPAIRLEYNYHAEGPNTEAEGFASDDTTLVVARSKSKTHVGTASFLWNFL
jgi:hypothetical protein